MCIVLNQSVYFEEMRVFQAIWLKDILAWNNTLRSIIVSVGCRDRVTKRRIIGGIYIAQSEVKFLDLCKIIDCGSICQECFYWSRTKVKGSKTIRYRCSLNHKPYRPEIGGYILRFRQHLERNHSFWIPGGVWSQDWNLKELTERHHQEWSVRLNSTQHWKTYQVRT